jgi:hypothetical protein
MILNNNTRAMLLGKEFEAQVIKSGGGEVW